MPDLVTLAIVRQALPRLATVSDVEVNRLIDVASDLIENYCRVSFGPSAITETHDDIGSGVVFLRSAPAGAIASITVGLPDNARVLTTDEYQFNAATGELRLSGAGDGFYPDTPSLHFWPGSGGFQSITVVYAGPTTVPPAVRQKCLDLISRQAAGMVAAFDPSIKSITADAVSVTYADGAIGGGASLTAADMMALNRYRRFSL